MNLTLLNCFFSFQMSVDEEDKGEGAEMNEISKYKKTDLEALCGQYAAYTRVNLAEEHGQIVTQIANMEEQLHTFSQLLEAISSSNSGVTCNETCTCKHSLHTDWRA